MFKSLAKNFANWVMGAFIFAGVSAAIASNITGGPVGVPPIPATGPGMVDGTWLNGLAGGQNFSYQSGIVAKAGGTQALATPLPIGIYLIEVDTVATTGDSVALPQCFQGSSLLLRNAGAGTLDVYGNPSNNPLLATAAADTINAVAGSTAYTLTTNTNAIFFCAKNGAWSAGKLS
jgi:hypothetical protein